MVFVVFSGEMTPGTPTLAAGVADTDFSSIHPPMVVQRRIVLSREIVHM